MAPKEGVGAAIYRGDGVGARHCHIIDPCQLPRSPLDELTASHDVDGFSKAVENRRRKERVTCGPHRLAGL